jgi:hypothetical protein
MGFSGMSSVVETLLLITRIVKPSTIQLSDIGCALVGVNGSGTLWWSLNLGSGGEYQMDSLAYNSVPAEDNGS